MEIKIDYVPTKKQELFHTSSADELLYGGAAGGGKSKAIVIEALIDALENPNIHSYLFRKTYPELKDTLIKETIATIPKEIGTYISADHDFRLYNGSVLHFRYCRNIMDAYTYQGVEMQRLYIDELTHFTKDCYDYLKTRLRATKSQNVKPKIRLTSNPGGVGHGWVKSYFIDNKPPFEIIENRVFSSVLNKETIVTTQYIPAYATDNPHLTDDYVIQLEQKPEAIRKALLLGDWNVFEGQVFSEFTNDSNHYLDRKFTHVIEPFKIPRHFRRFRSFDFGYSKPFSVGYWAMDNDGVLYRYAEIYGSPKDDFTRMTKSPNVGMKLDPAGIARLIREYEEKYEKGNEIIGIADPSIFDESRGSDGCVAKIFEREGIYFERGDNKRIAGKMQLHYRFSFDENGYPKIYIFNCCKDFIRTMQSIVYDVTNQEDIDSNCEDHIYDETRYMCMYAPIMPPKKFSQSTKNMADPLNLFERQVPTLRYDYNLKL
jgi:hypothetical protein